MKNVADLNLEELLSGLDVILVEQDGIQGLMNFRKEFETITEVSMDEFKSTSSFVRNNNLHAWINMDHILALEVSTGNYELFKNS